MIAETRDNHTADRARPEADGAGPRPSRRRAADGRDRPRAVDEIAAHRHGRADLGAEFRPRSTSFSHRPRPQGAGPEHHLRHPPAGRGDEDLRPLHGTSRRQAGRQRQRSPKRRRRHHPPDGRSGGQGALFAAARAGDRPATSRCGSRASRGGATRRIRTRPCSTMSRSRSGAARSWASPGWSAPGAPRWRAPSSAPILSIPAD